MKKVLLVAAVVLSGSVAMADVPAWLCALNFTGKSKSVQIIVGKSEFKGTGTVRCVSADNERVEMPVKISMNSHFAPRIGIGKMELYGEALQVAVAGNPQSLLGSYLVFEGRGAIGVGAGVIAATKVDDESLTLSLSLQLVTGGGIELGFRKMKIELDSSRL